MAGGRSDIPSVVYVTSDDRALKKAPTPSQVPPDEPARNWLATYSSDRALVTTMYRYALTQPAEFQEALDTINSFLEHKRIVGFEADLSLMVETEFGGKHDVYALSTGERQALILIAYAYRWLKPGGILLVDEPAAGPDV